MVGSRKFVVLGLLIGLALVLAGLALGPFGNAHAATATGDVAERIGAAFRSVPAAAAEPALVTAAAERAAKGDLPSRNDCRAATWPAIDAACLAAANGRPVPAVRTVTIGYQAGSATTVLLRIPATEMAQK
jgi:hypothetical protein